MHITAGRLLRESYLTMFGPVVRRGVADADLEGPQGQLLSRLADALFDIERLRIETPEDVAALLVLHSGFHEVFESDDDQ